MASVDNNLDFSVGTGARDVPVVPSAEQTDEALLRGVSEVLASINRTRAHGETAEGAVVNPQAFEVTQDLPQAAVAKKLAEGTRGTPQTASSGDSSKKGGGFFNRFRNVLSGFVS